MTRDIRKILRKKSWNGKEVGQAIILSFLNDYQHREKPSHKPLFTQVEIDRMVLGLKNERERQVYAGYVQLYQNILEEFNRSQAYLQQAQHGCLRISAQLKAASAGEKARKMLAKEPIVVTQGVYDTLSEELAARLPAQEESWAGLVWHTLCWYLHDFDGPKPRKPAALGKALDELKQLPMPAALYPDATPYAKGGGAFVLSGGARTDISTPEQVLEQLHAIPAFARIFPRSVEFPPELLTSLLALLYIRWEKQEKEPPLAWEPKKIIPHKNAWEALVKDHTLREYYRQPSALVGEGAAPVFAAFVQAFPTLYEALVTSLMAQPGLYANLPCAPTEATVPRYSYGDLAQQGIYAYQQLLVPAGEAVAAAWQAEHPSTPCKGIAVWRGDSPAGPPDFTEERSALTLALNGYIPLVNDEETKAEMSSARRDLLLPALRWLTAYNTLLGLLEETHELQGLSLLSADLTHLLLQVQQLSEEAFTLCARYAGEDAKMLRNTEKMLPLFFSPIEQPTLYPRETTVIATRALLHVPNALEDHQLSQMILQLANSREMT